jgi:cation/acetate symporter
MRRSLLLSHNSIFDRHRVRGKPGSPHGAGSLESFDVKKPLTDEDLLERAAIDGRVAFATAAFALAAGLVALLDRVGVPERLVAALGPITALTGLATVGLLLRSMRISRFYAGGRAVPAVYAGLALASLAAGLFMPFVLPVPGGTSLTGLIVGFGAGLVVASLVVGPLLRKTGAFSVPDLLAARFPKMALRLGSVVVVAAVAVLITLAGYDVAVRTLVLASGAERGTASLLIGLVLVMIVVPGGLAGVVWSATGAAGIFLAGLGLPLAVQIAHGGAVPLPIVGDRDLWERAQTLMIGWHATGASAPSHMSALLIVAIAVGVGVLAPLLSPAITCRDAGTAQRAGFAALVWSLVVVAGVAATMAIAALALDEGLVGLRPEGLASFVYTASGKGLVTICGQAVADPEAARTACTAVPGFGGLLRPADIAANGEYLILGLPELRRFGVAFSGLVEAGTIAVALVLAAAGIEALGTALGHDVFYRVRDTRALTSRRLAVTRAIMLVTIVAIGVLLAVHPIDPPSSIGLALAFSAAAIAPLLILSLWPRASSADATIALLAGLASAEAVIVAGGAAPSIERLAASSVIACVIATLAGFTASLLHRNDPMSQGGAFVHGLWHGESDVLHPDKGA